MKFVILICYILVCQVAAAQQVSTNDSTYQLQYDNLIQKQRNNKVAGWALAGAGAVLFGIGLAQPAPHYYIDNDPRKGYEKFKGSGWRISGACLGLASLPFFMSALKNGKKALAIKREHLAFLPAAKYTCGYTALVFKVKL